MPKFLGKNPRKKVVRQFPNGSVPHVIKKTTVEEEKVIKENNSSKKEKDMADERLKKIEDIMGTKAPKKKVKREKKDRGLIERTESSMVILTEDNKMLLND